MNVIYQVEEIITNRCFHLAEEIENWKFASHKDYLFQSAELNFPRNIEKIFGKFKSWMDE